MKSIIAGMLIALAAVIYLSISSSLNTLVGSFFFSLGLLIILGQRFFLFTGKAGKLSTGEIAAKDLAKIWLGNLCGVLITSFVATNWMSFTIAQNATQIAAARMSADPMSLLVGGIFCGMLMYVATLKGTPHWMTIMCVMAFICAGFYHCVADMAYFCLAQRVEWWPMIRSLGFVTIGNVIGCNIIPIVEKYIKLDYPNPRLG